MADHIHIPDKMTIGEALAPAMTMTDEADARRYFAALVDRQMRVFGQDRTTAERDNSHAFAWREADTEKHIKGRP